jgi:hypothetical protein
VRKLIFCNLDLLKRKLDPDDYANIDWDSFDFEKQKKRQEKFKKKFNELADDTDNKVYFYSRKADVLKNAIDYFSENGYDHFRFKSRNELKEFVNTHRNKNNYFVFVGSKNKDFEMAVNTRSLYIVPTWLPMEDKAQKYGVHVDTVKQLCKFILTLNNQNTWYSKLPVDSVTTCYSLMDARYGHYARTSEEKDMLLHFQELLKEGKSRNYYQILLYHFLAGMTNTATFDDIELYGMIPSSNCNVNEDLYSFMEQIRCLKGIQPVRRKYPEDFRNKDKNLLIRHTPKNKAHIGRSADERAELGGNDEFTTICINPDYKKRIKKLREKGRFNVCIFDDYMTHGNSFNSVRNLLESLGANKIVCVSLGLFRYPFQKRDYTISGDVYGKNYTFKLETCYRLINFEINEDAKEEVSDLYDIFNS